MSDSFIAPASWKTSAVLVLAIVATASVGWIVATTSPVLTAIAVVAWTVGVLGWGTWLTRKVLRQAEEARQHREVIAECQLNSLCDMMRDWLEEHGRATADAEAAFYKAFMDAKGMTRGGSVTPIRKTGVR